MCVMDLCVCVCVCVCGHGQEKAAIWKQQFGVPPDLNSPSPDSDNASALSGGEESREGGGEDVGG